jgi:carbon starvation protein
LAGAIVFFVICFFTYGKFMAGVYELSEKNKTPAEAMYDGVDYCPAHPAVLLGHHFSSIAGAGPVTGPIAAASVFGWLPTYLWCVIGSAFLGGPHDMGALVASMRHEGKSMGEVVDRWIGRRGKILFLLFTIITIVLVVAVFLQLSANSCAADPAVAFSSSLYVLLAVVFGFLVYRMNFPLWLMTIIMVPLIVYACWLGKTNPSVSNLFSFSGNPALEYHQGVTKDNFEEKKTFDDTIKDFETYDQYAAAKKDLFNKNMSVWRWILVAYICFASVLPVWLLLQPRDYLASYFLYFAVIVGCLGMFLGADKLEVKLPMFTSFAPTTGQYLWPMLFITVACGALSGFHSLVGSGTTSKQIRTEKDARLIGYGAMLIEGVVAVIATATIMISGKMIGDPMETYATGFGRFAGLIGIEPSIGKSLGLLALNTFLITSLDTATRLGRYLIQELFNMAVDRYTATGVVVVCAVGMLMMKTHNPAGAEIPVWSALWPMFGSANQLVGGLVLLSLAVWVARALKKDNKWLLYPMWFMLITTIAALCLMIYDQLFVAKLPNYLLGGLAIALTILALLMLQQALAALRKKA